ncbi:hypothetical protein LTR05_006437 [Lithohypha guttulata]|uniref:DUF7726 domain-containing protein n=1 Tax=Lithohypha guttulata TaxID=1690604 RepID=A0AAN7SYF1_9EURO|nr:hypothetical protein LTR05_006437 [Lithohypha guttulata]
MPSLEGEETGDVETYDICDDVRRKVRAHLKKQGVTQAGFCREISKCLGRGETSIQSAQLASFLKKKKKGTMAGNTSKAFYASYVYFESMRVRDKKPKSSKRLQMESE